MLSVQLVMMVGVLIAIIPLVLIFYLDLERLQRWKEQHVATAQAEATSSECIEEPLLPKAPAGDSRAGLTGHAILVQDAAMGHWEVDASAGFHVQQGLLDHSAAEAGLSGS